MKNNSAKIYLGVITCILMLVFALVYYFVFVAEKNTIEFKPENYVIQFDSTLLGEEFESSGNEIKECNYKISFLDNNKFTIYMNFGNSIEGTYNVSNNTINCIITSAVSEYTTQKINSKISFKINHDSEIEVLDVPESYTIKLSEVTDNGWTLTNETKEMNFWPLVKGIKYLLDK